MFPVSNLLCSPNMRQPWKLQKIILHSCNGCNVVTFISSSCIEYSDCITSGSNGPSVILGKYKNTTLVNTNIAKQMDAWKIEYRLK